MDYLQFFASIIESIVWPITVVVGILLLRRNIETIVPYIQRIKVKDFELDLKEAKQELPLEVTFEPAPDLLSKTKDQFSDLYQLAELSPRAAILESWLQVESALSKLALAKLDDQGAMLAIPPLRLNEYLKRKSVISNEQYRFVNRLRELRNKSVHLLDMNISLDEASDYIDLARSVTTQFERKGFS
tara:strand:+ start:1330 stop:1890 length:561 start_codon:yes stop_codon:yes gene_type:complete